MRELLRDSIATIYKNDLQALEGILRDNSKVIDLHDEDGRNLLFYAVLDNNLLATQLLIESGMNINLHDKIGWTPLHYAANEHLAEVTNLLLKSGADVNAQDSYGNTVIWRAVFASKGRSEIISLLLKNGGDPDIKNNNGISARKLAQTIGNYDIEQFLA